MISIFFFFAVQQQHPHIFCEKFHLIQYIKTQQYTKLPFPFHAFLWPSQIHSTLPLLETYDWLRRWEEVGEEVGEEAGDGERRQKVGKERGEGRRDGDDTDSQQLT